MQGLILFCGIMRKKRFSFEKNMIHFYYGEETFQSSSRLRQLKKDFSEHNVSESMVFDCDEECNVRVIAESFGVQDLFSQKKMIVIKNLFAHTKVDEQKELIESLRGVTDDMIIFWEGFLPRKNAALFAWLQKNADEIFESNNLQGFELEKWIEQQCKKQRVRMTQPAVRELILYVGNDLWHISREIDKLGCYVGENEVSAQDVQMLVKGRVDADMFETVESVVAGNKSKALTLLKKQLAKGDEAFYIFSMYAYQLRTLLAVSGVMEDDKIHDKNVVAKTLKIHPFVAQKSLATLQRLPQDHLKKMHKKLTSLDFDIKQGKRDVHEALDIFITSV